jgi:phosphonate utilization transcriptional regulator PhnR
VQYLKIKETILEQIEAGLLIAGQKLPSERSLSETFDTTRVTLREALSLLEAEAKVFREDRRGWFISPEPLKYDPSTTANFDTLATNQGRVGRSELISAKVIPANRQAITLLNVPALSNIININRVRYLDGRPVAFVSTLIRPEKVPKLLHHDVTTSLTNTYKHHYGITYSTTRYRMSSTSLLGSTAQHLRATTGTPAMLIERLNMDQNGQIIDCQLEFWRHDAICIESNIELKLD